MRSKTLSRPLLLILLLLGFRAQPSWGQSAGSEGTVAHLKALTFSENPNQTTIDILADRAFDYTSYYPNPRLFILDVLGAESSLEKNFVDFKTAQVDFANVTIIGEGQKPMVRIEFNLVRAIQYSLQSDRGKLRLVLSSLRQSLPQTPLAGSVSPKSKENSTTLQDQKGVTRDVSIVEDERELTLSIQTTAKPEFKFFELDSPNRIVVDVEGSEFKVSHQSLRLRTDLIQKIRFGYGESQQGKLVRCVFDVSRKSPYTVEASESGLVIRFHKQAVASVRQPSAPVEKQPESAALAGLDRQLPEPGILAANGQWADSSKTIDTLHFVGVQHVVLPEPLASPAAALEGPISLGDIEPSNLKTDVAVLNSEPQVIEALPPREPEPAPSVPAVTPSPETVQGSGDGGSTAGVSTAPEARPVLSGEVKASLVSESPDPPPAQTPVAEVAPVASPLQSAAPADPMPEADNRTPAVSSTQALAVSEVKSEESIVNTSQAQDTNTTKLQPDPVAEKQAETIQPAPLMQNLLAVTKPQPEPVVEKPVENIQSAPLEQDLAVAVTPPQPEPVVEKQPEAAHPATVNQNLPVAKNEPQTVAMLQNTEPPAPVTSPAPTPVSVQSPVSNPAGPIPLPAQTVTGQVISAPAPTTAPKYSGDLISLELKDADLKDFFRLIGEISGLNIVLDPDVKGSLTIFLNDVPWDQALDVVMKNNGLGKQLDGNVLRIAANTTLELEETQRKRLSDARVVAAELQTETRILSYAKAADMSAIIKKVLSPRGDIIVDVRTNSMIITDIPQMFARIDNLIRQLDRKIKQVEIEARVIATTRDFLRDIGVQIGAIYGNGDKNTVSGAVPGNPFSRQPPPSVTVGQGQSGGAQNSIPLLSNLGAVAATSGVAFFSGITDKFLLDTIITAAERRGSAKLLSKPKIITQDNIEGSVQQGVKIPVQTTINNTVSVQFFDFALKLTVTPQITDEGTIIMKVDIENSTPDFSRQVQGVPTVNTQQTKTTVLVSNGGTVVVGGVMIDNEQTNVRQVPGFGSLPVLGYLFKEKSVNKQTQELIFFLSPKIL
jgi:type IV pilus secretin PilQ/predicted competence protein